VNSDYFVYFYFILFFSISKDSVQETYNERDVILKLKVRDFKQGDKDICRVQQVSNSLCCCLLLEELDPVSGNLQFYFK
jgi:hypothetical protein